MTTTRKIAIKPRSIAIGAALAVAFALAAGARLTSGSPQRAPSVDGAAGEIQVGPFTQASVQSASGIVVDAGALVLAPGKRWGVALLAPVKAPVSFDTVQMGIRHVQPEGTSIRTWLRVLDESGQPASRWQSMRREAEMLVNVHVQAVQVMVQLQSHDGHASPRIEGLLFDTSERRAPSLTGPAQVIDVPRPPVKTRAQWGARNASEKYDPLTPSILTVHHTWEPRASAYTGAATIRGIQDYHMDTHGWIDIGYHFLIGPDGVIYEGRPETAMGAHSPPNDGKLGVCVIGNFNVGQETVTALQRKSLVALLGHLAGKYSIPVTSIFGHRDFNNTDCPGDTLYADLPHVRQDVQHLLDQAASGAGGGAGNGSGSGAGSRH